MKVSQPELLGSAAIILYIVLFAHSPPTALRRALSNVFVASSVFAVIAYITLWRSRTLGVLLTLAFLLTMTRVTEHAVGDVTSDDKSSTPPTNTPGNPTPPTPGATGPVVSGDSTGATGASGPGNTTVSSDAKNTAAPAQTPSPDATLNASVPLPTAPAIPPAPTFPSPVMSCNVESFTPF